MGKEKLSVLKIPIPYKRAGNVIIQQEVEFELLWDEPKYVLVPFLSEDQLRLANLPPRLEFYLQGNKPVSVRGPQDGNFHVITDAFQKMKQLNLVPH